MGSLSLVTVIGSLLASSGDRYSWQHLNQVHTPQPIETIGREDVMVLYSNRSLAAYQYMASKMKNENIVFSAMDTFTTLYGLYKINRGSKIYNPWLRSFFYPFVENGAMIQALDTNIGSSRRHAISGRLTLASTVARRYGCSVLDYNASLLTNGMVGKEIAYTTLRDGVRVFNDWYNSLEIESQFDDTEFYGEECAILLSGSRFRQYWEPTEACALRADFLTSKNIVQENVTFTRLTHELPGYGELPELDARYIEVPWGISNLLDEKTELHLYVILPNTVDGINKLEKKITNHTIAKMLREARKTVVDVSLPEISVTRKYHLPWYIGNVPVEPNQITPSIGKFRRPVDAITVSKFEAFQAPAKLCGPTGYYESSGHPDIPRFNADRPFLAVVGVEDIESGIFTTYQLVRFMGAE